MRRRETTPLRTTIISSIPDMMNRSKAMRGVTGRLDQNTLPGIDGQIIASVAKALAHRRGLNWRQSNGHAIQGL